MSKHTGKDNPFKAVRILRAKIKDKVHIEYEIEHNKITDSMTLESEDEALPEFKNALQEMRGQICELCELDEDNVSRIKVLGVSLKYEGEAPNRRMGAVITATRRLKKTNGTMLLNTPYLLEATNDKKNGRGVLPPELEEQIHLVINEARKYLNGERAQTKIDFPEKEKES